MRAMDLIGNEKLLTAVNIYLNFDDIAMHY